MLKISRIRPCEYNKSCSTLHDESNKIEFAFFWFFYDFVWILQNLAIHNYYWSFILRLGPWKEVDPHRHTFGLRIKLWKVLGPSHWVPGTSGRCGSGKCRWTGGAPGRGRGQGGPQAHLGRVGAWRLGGKTPTTACGDRRRRRRWPAWTLSKLGAGKLNARP
jgi:hypothetical protein